MTGAATPDFAGLGLEDLYRPIIPSPPPDADDQGDPYLLTVPPSEGTAYRYYLFHTDVAERGDRIPVYGSDDLRRFEPLGRALRTDVELSQHWAPCVVRTPSTGLWTMFYSRSAPGQRDPDVGHRLRRAVAEDPAGPFVDQGEFPLPPGTGFDDGFAIDADVYRRGGGPDDWYLAYVVEFWDEERVGVGVVEVALSPDHARPVSEPRVLVKPSADVQLYERDRSMPWQVGRRDWSAGETVDWHCIEAPIGGLRSPAGRRYWLTSFGSYKDDTYTVGAVREEPDGSVTDLAGEGHAVLRSSTLPGITSAGHPSLVTPDLLLSHGRFTPGGPRRAFLAPLLWDAQDRPYCPDRDELVRLLGGSG